MSSVGGPLMSSIGGALMSSMGGAHEFHGGCSLVPWGRS